MNKYMYMIAPVISLGLQILKKEVKRMSNKATRGGDSIPAGTFHGGDSIPAGTFHGGDSIPAGTFH